MRLPTISVVVASRGPSPTLARFLSSLGRAEGVERAEVLLGLNGGDGVDATRALAERHLGSTAIRLVSLPSASPAETRNRVVLNATAPLLLFLDDDVEVPADLLVRARETMADLGVDAAGGPNLTPASSTRFERLAGRVLASALGTGPVRHRYRTAPAGAGSERNLMLCNLAIRRSAFPSQGFDGELRCAEENDLFARLGASQATVVYRPDLAVYHHRRGSLRTHLAQIAKYGFGRGQMLVRAFSWSQLAFTVPSFLLLTALALIPLAPLVALGAALVYTVVLLAGSLRLGSVRDAPIVLALLAETHLGYAGGVLAGTLFELWRRARSRESR